MAQSKLLVETLKKELKRQNYSYRDVAVVLKLSESSVKRLFSEGGFALDRLDRICEMLGMEVSDLARLAEESMMLTSSLTEEQENELVANPKLMLMAFFLVNRWAYSEIMETYNISETEGIRLLAKLDRMKIIQLLPGNKAKLMISGDFKWIQNGPIQRFYEQRVQPDFLRSTFDKDGEYRVFMPVMLTPGSNTEMLRKLERLAADFHELSVKDQSHPVSELVGTCLLVAMRPFTGGREFDRLRTKAVRRF